MTNMRLGNVTTIITNHKLRPIMPMPCVTRNIGIQTFDSMNKPIIDFKNWTAGATYTKIDNAASDATEGMDGIISQISVGYNFSHGFGIDVGHVRSNEEGETSKRLGSLLRYHADF